MYSIDLNGGSNYVASKFGPGSKDETKYNENLMLLIAFALYRACRLALSFRKESAACYSYCSKTLFFNWLFFFKLE